MSHKSEKSAQNKGKTWVAMERKAQSLSYVDIRRCTSTYVVRASTYVHARRHRHRRQRRGTDFEQERVRARERSRSRTRSCSKSVPRLNSKWVPLQKHSPNPPKILPKHPKIEPKSNPEASKTTFEDHPKYKHEKTMPKNDPRGRQSLQTSPKTLPKPLPKRALDPSKCPF